MRRHPELPPGVRRTLERRVRFWKARHGWALGGVPKEHRTDSPVGGVQEPEARGEGGSDGTV